MNTRTSPYINRVVFGDCRQSLQQMAQAGIKAQTCVTSPPYFGLRDYGVKAQLGLETTIDDYVASLVAVFRCVWDVLTDDGTLWVNLGDSYGAKKQLLMVPARVALALQADGWTVRQDIIWHKPNPMPESVKDRCTKAHEYIFLFSKSPSYYFDSKAMREPCSEDMQRRAAAGHTRGQGKIDASRNDAATVRPRAIVADGRNKRSVWTVATKPFSGAHFATFPPGLIEPCILAGSRPGDLVLDPFMGSGTTAFVAKKFGRDFCGCELNPEYGELINERLGVSSETKKSMVVRRRRPVNT